MRHNRAINHLGRQSGHRKAMLANMASSLILSKQIETTVAKAKALRTYVEPLITKSKEDTTHSRRIVFSYLKQKEAVSELFRVVAPKIADRPGGYTRIVRTGFRVGDAADMAIIQLVDFAEGAEAAPEKEVKRASTRRSGRKNQEGEGKTSKSRKANSPKVANENVTKAAPAARKVQAPRKSGNS
ncbi:MAG: 50S ribosomal protein L17 [Bacteroidales bacterium]|jgi:large subunit ribosomal protein L17|nr:50S ribosomal protein L17 [Bacteroidales bacterium]MBQ6957757.1 50S ribosomal protein L17 [Bacteroidales bacterium]MBR3065646.1 50S ribosomal protein L17 [Bacteroidales bacterium]